MKNSKPVMVVGATGFLGTEICRQLVAANYKVKGLVRSTSDPEKVKVLRDLGVETVAGDIKELSSLEKAFIGVSAVISTASSTFSRSEGDSIETVDRLGQLNVVEAAEASHVKQFIFISFLASAESFPLQDAKREVERRLQNSNMSFTILRPTFFMELWLGKHLGFDAMNAKASIYGNGLNKISWIAIKDVAAFAVASLDNASARNSIIDLGGPEAVSPMQVIKLFEEKNGKGFRLVYIPQEVIKDQKESSNDPAQQSFSALMLTYAAGAEVPMDETLKRFQITRLTTVEDYRDNLLRGVELDWAKT